MKKQLFQITTTLCLGLMLTAAATAQITRQMTATIPFAFYVGKTALPAGTYTLYDTGTKTGDGFLLRAADGHAKVVFNAQEVQSGDSRSITRFEFRRYNDKYFLAKVWTSGSNIGRGLQQSKLERETAQSASQHMAQKDVKLEVVSVASQ